MGMKVIERLAKDWVRSQIGRGGPVLVNHSDTHVEDAAIAAYQAGFREARGMSLQCVLNGDRIPNGSYTVDIEEAIKTLGEKESPPTLVCASHPIMRDEACATCWEARDRNER